MNLVVKWSLRRLRASGRSRRWQSDVAVNLVLVRHGQSRWNAKNRFTGWTDVQLTAQGEREAWAAGRLLSTGAHKIEAAFTSYLTRAQRTTALILEAADEAKVEAVRTWKLNERHYGAFTGLSKKETMVAFGAEETMAVRRGSASPPPLTEDHAMWKHVMRDENNRRLDQTGELPRGESLQACRARVAEFCRSHIFPKLAELAARPIRTSSDLTEEVPTVLVVSHMHTLRLLIAELDQLDEDELRRLEVPTATPLLYRLDASLEPVDARSFLGGGGKGATGGAPPLEEQPALRGRWLGGQGSINKMPVPSIVSLLLRRPAVLFELMPHLPERVQELCVRPEEAFLEVAQRQTQAHATAHYSLHAADQVAALRDLYETRPWVGQIDVPLCDACARAVDSIDLLAARRRKKKMMMMMMMMGEGGGGVLGNNSALTPDAFVDDDNDAALVSWARSTNARAPARAAVAALLRANRGTLKPQGTAHPVKLQDFPDFAKLAAVVAYLTWLTENGADFLPERGCHFAKAIAKPGMLADEEIEEDLAPLPGADPNQANHPPRRPPASIMLWESDSTSFKPRNEAPTGERKQQQVGR